MKRWKVSTEWVWVSILALLVENFIYDLIYAAIQCFAYKVSKRIAFLIKRIRDYKTAEFQE